MVTAACEYPPFCFLRDQVPISQEAYRRSVELRGGIRSIIARRNACVGRAGGDPEIHLPGGNWRLGNPLYDAYHAVIEGDYSVINNLRLFSQIFTGFQLLTQSRCADKPIPREVPPDSDDTLRRVAVSPDPWGYAYVSTYANTVRYLPEQVHISPPRTFGEVGWVIDGKLVNHDTYVYLERLVLLGHSGKLWELRNRVPPAGRDWPDRPRILEIGSGYGGLAYHVKQLVPQARYFCVDIPESLVFSSIYLSTLYPGEDNVLVTPGDLGGLTRDTAGFTFLPNFLFGECLEAGLKFDLIINTLSMSEMTEKQVRYYSGGIAGLLGERGVFFEQNQDNRVVGMLNACDVIADCLPYRLPLESPWRPVTQGKAHLWATTPAPPYSWQPTRPGRAAGRERVWGGAIKSLGKMILRPVRGR